MQLSPTLSFAIALSSLAAIAGCGSSSTPAPTGEYTNPDAEEYAVASTKQGVQSNPVTPTQVEAVVHGNTAFAIDLYRQLAAEPGNLFLSPFSISESLAMIWAGARGATEEQMARALHLDLSQSQTHPTFNAIHRALARHGQGPEGAPHEGFHLSIANALWGQQGYLLAIPFLDTLAHDYGAGAHVVDFVGAPESARATINGWMAERTAGRTEELLPPGSITGTTRLILGDAVHFNAAWKTPFQSASTRFASFTRRDGSSIEVPTMSATQNLNYGVGPDYAALQLPYDGGELSMVLLLPPPGGLDAFEASLTADRLAAIVANLEPRSVFFTLPCFKIESSVSLQDQLARLGMPIAFTDAADFSGINGRGGLSLSAVIHQAFVDVDEAGTEAAAATTVGFTTTSAYLPTELRFERPYLFLIRDGATGTVVFLGRVDDPSI
ncbi:MAG: serpin family protein [Byssovorax sp.]